MDQFQNCSSQLARHLLDRQCWCSSTNVNSITSSVARPFLIDNPSQNFILYHQLYHFSFPNSHSSLKKKNSSNLGSTLQQFHIKILLVLLLKYLSTLLSNYYTSWHYLFFISIITFRYPAKFAEIAFKSFLCSFSVQATDEKLSRPVCLRHSQLLTSIRNKWLQYQVYM